MSADAVHLLQARGFNAVQLRQGVVEWDNSSL